MRNLFPIKISLAIVGILVVGAGAFSINGVLNPQFTDGGVDVRNTKCEDIASARLAVAAELGERKLTAQNSLDKEKEKNSNDYWERNQKLEADYYQCISKALTADPCKEPSDKITKLYEEIMADFDAGKGFNEAKFNEREQVKKDYNECVEKTHKPEFYKEKSDKCDVDLASGRETNNQARATADNLSKTRYDQALAEAEKAHNEKQELINAIEKKCTEPGKKTNISIGPLTTESSGAAVQPNNPACTEIFPGNDPNILRQISKLESQLQKAKAGGQSSGLFGTEHIQEALDRLREELKNSPRTCKVDADCGSVVPVCCSGEEVGRVFCNSGVCSAEKTKCISPEICAGKPAMCVAPFMGAQQQDGVYITRTIPEVGSCLQNLQILNLQQGTPDSSRYSIVGNIPNWLHIDKPSGALPGSANITYSCDTVQDFGPGTYTVAGSVTVYNSANELVNTIPLNVSITVTATEKVVDVIDYNGKFLPINQLIVESEKGCDGGTKHWHAKTGFVTATDGSKVSDPGPQCGYGKVKDKPIQQIPAPKSNTSKSDTGTEVRGFEFLKN